MVKKRKRLTNEQRKRRLIRLAKEADLRDINNNPELVLNYRIKHWFKNHFKVGGETPVSFKLLYLVYQTSVKRMQLSYGDFVSNIRYFYFNHTTPTHINLSVPSREHFFKKITKILYKEVKRDKIEKKEKEENPQAVSIKKIYNEQIP